MPIHALDAVDDAADRTRTLVVRLDAGDWLKLGGVTLFVGGLGSASFTANLPREFVRSLPVWTPPSVGVGTTVAVVAAATVLATLVAVRSLLTFVFYAALWDGHVSLRRSVRRWWQSAVQLWALRVTTTWTAFVVVALGGAGLGWVGWWPAGLDATPLVTAAVFVALAAYALFSGLTSRFVVPVMMTEEVGIVHAWRRFARVVAASPGQYAAYLLVGLVVRFVADVLALSAAVLLAALLAVPVAVFVVPAVLVLSEAPRLALSPPLVLLAAGLPAAYVLTVLVGATLARLPFVVYVREFALSVLGRTAPELRR